MASDSELVRRAIDYAKSGDFGPQALATNLELARVAPANEGAWTRLSRCYLEGGQLDQATAALDAVLQLNPQNTIARSLQVEVTRRRVAATVPVSLRTRAPRAPRAPKVPRARERNASCNRRVWPRRVHNAWRACAGGRPRGTQCESRSARDGAQRARVRLQSCADPQPRGPERRSAVSPEHDQGGGAWPHPGMSSGRTVGASADAGIPVFDTMGTGCHVRWHRIQRRA